MSGCEDFYGDTSPFDEEMEQIKEHLRSSVKEEISAELTRLRTENDELKGRLANLGTLEQEAARAKSRYEQKLHNAEVVARRTVENEGLMKLLALLDEPRYRVEQTSTIGPKCDKCDADRKLHYTTPRGRDAEEWCECYDRIYRWEVQELLVHEVKRNGGNLLAWYHAGMRYFDDDCFSSPTVLKSSVGLTLEEMIKNPRDYGFYTEEAAAVLAAALNKEEA